MCESIIIIHLLYHHLPAAATIERVLQCLHPPYNHIIFRITLFIAVVTPVELIWGGSKIPLGNPVKP